MFIAVLSLLSSSFEFKGGSDWDLVERLAATVKGPVAIMPVSGRTWKPTSFKYQKEPELKKALEGRLGFRFPDPASGAVTGPAWPEEFYFKRRFRSSETPLLVDPSPIMRKADDRVMISIAKGKVIGIAAINALDLSKPMQWHPFFDNAMFVVRATEAPERDLILAVAAAAGATLVEDDKRYFLDFNVPEFRKRTRALLSVSSSDKELRNRRIANADRRFQSLFLDSLSDQQIKRGYSNPETTYVFPYPPTSPVHTAAWQRIDARFGEFDGNDRGLAPVHASAAAIAATFAEMRRDGRVLGIFSADGDHYVGYENEDRSSRIDLTR